jgi:hypothetical protein
VPNASPGATHSLRGCSGQTLTFPSLVFRPFACFIGRVYAAPHGSFLYHPENVARAARLPGASRTAGGSRPARPSSIAVPLVTRGGKHAWHCPSPVVIGPGGPSENRRPRSSAGNPHDEFDERRLITAARPLDSLFDSLFAPHRRVSARWRRAR